MSSNVPLPRPVTNGGGDRVGTAVRRPDGVTMITFDPPLTIDRRADPLVLFIDPVPDSSPESTVVS